MSQILYLFFSALIKLTSGMMGLGELMLRRRDMGDLQELLEKLPSVTIIKGLTFPRSNHNSDWCRYMLVYT
jgi:hypothetical protein